MPLRRNASLDNEDELRQLRLRTQARNDAMTDAILARAMQRQDVMYGQSPVMPPEPAAPSFGESQLGGGISALAGGLGSKLVGRLTRPSDQQPAYPVNEFASPVVRQTLKNADPGAVVNMTGHNEFSSLPAPQPVDPMKIGRPQALQPARKWDTFTSDPQASPSSMPAQFKRGGGGFLGKLKGLAGFEGGGRWDGFLNQPVEVAERGAELVVDDDGDEHLFRRPQVTVPTEPGVVMPAGETRALLRRPLETNTSAGPAPSDSSVSRGLLRALPGAMRPPDPQQPGLNPPQNEVKPLLIPNKTGGGVDIFDVNSDDMKPGEHPRQMLRRLDLERAMAGGGDPEFSPASGEGPAMFKPPGEEARTPLDVGYKFAPGAQAASPVGRAVPPPTSPYSRLRPQEGGTPPFVAPGTQVLSEDAPVMPSRLQRPAGLPRASATVNDGAGFSNEPHLQSRLRRALDVPPNGPQAASPQQEPSADVGTVPVNERRQMILDAAADSSAVGARPGARGGAQPSAGRPAFDHSSYDRNRARIESRITELLDLQDTPVVDKNGRLKSTFLGILQGFLGGGIGGAIYGGIRGGVSPEWDEQIKHAAEVAKKRGNLEEVQKAMGQLADLDKTYASLSGGGMTQAQLSTQRRGMANYITKYFPQGYTRGTRPDVDAELERLQMEPPPALPRKGGTGRGYVVSAGQMIAVPDGSGGFTYQVPHDSEGNDAPAMSQSQVQMADADRRRIQLSLAELNLRRAKENLAPITFDDYVTGGDTPTAPAAPAGSSAPPVQTPPVSRAGGPQLVPSGQKREPVQVRGAGRGGFHRGGGRGGSSAGGSERDLGFAESGAAGARAQAQEARARAARYRSEGRNDLAVQEDKSAAAWDAKAKVEEGRAARARGRGGSSSAPAVTRGPDPLGILN